MENQYTNTTVLPSSLQIGDPCFLELGSSRIEGFVRAVTFTSSKVRYSVWIEHDETTVHNIDSCFVVRDKNPTRESREFDEDNFS